MLKWFVLVPFLLMVSSASAAQYQAKVLAVLDGDTILIQRSNEHPQKVRLLDIDAPEIAQADGFAAKQALSRLVLNQQVRIQFHAHDNYGRIVADVFVGGQNLSVLMVEQGWAWEYSRFHRNQNLVRKQQTARQHKKGLWLKSAPLAPWLWRKQNPTQPMDSRCREKRYCSQMSSCQQAIFYLQLCQFHSLDADGDGMPCESLCRANE